MSLPKELNPFVVVVSRQEVETRDIKPALGTLRRLIESPEVARSFVERVDIAFYGYDDDPRELFEIQEVRQYVSDLDVKFPFWLFFLSKKHLGLQCLLWCNLPPYLTPEGRADIFPRRIGELLTKRWFPAMNHVCNFAGYSEEQVELLTDRAIEYINNGRLPLDSPVPERLR